MKRRTPMKRTAINRKTPLKSGGGNLRRSELKRGTKPLRRRAPIGANRKRLEREAPGRGVTPEDRRAVLERDGWACLRCGAREDLVLDHVRALCNGGAHDVSNLAVLCRDCNLWKGTATIDFRQPAGDPGELRYEEGFDG